MKQILHSLKKWDTIEVYMNELESLKKIGEAHYRQNCPYKSDPAGHPLSCSCSRAANIWAFRQYFIPEFYRDFTLEHFNGKVGGKKEQILSSSIILRAKEAFKRFCFKEVDECEYSEQEWLEKSIMNERREHGHNLIIYGNPYRMVSVQASSSSGRSEVKPVKKPIGRTMLACLILREAINLRWRPGHEGDSYCFEKYDQLVQRLLKQASGDKSYEQEINVYKDCDWLVVDDISVRNETDAAKRFRTSVLNSLFGERVAAGLPNILVFQDDLSKMGSDLEFEFGSFITDIIRNKKTHRIALVEDGK